MKVGEVEDGRWIECDGRTINKSDYELLYKKLTEANGIFSFSGNVMTDPPVPEFSNGPSILYIKRGDFILFGATVDVSPYAYFSNDGGKSWTATNATRNMVRYTVSNGDFFMWEDGKILISDCYNDNYYYSADGINFTTASGSSGQSTRPACNKNGFVFDSFYSSGNYRAKYSLDYYIDADLLPSRITTDYELINDNSRVDDDYDIYTIDSSFVLSVFSEEDYSLIYQKDLTAVVGTITSAKIVVIADERLYFSINGDLYLVSDFKTFGEMAEIQKVAATGWLPTSSVSGKVHYDGMDMIYVDEFYYIIDSTPVPDHSGYNTAGNKWYIKAK